MDVYVVTLSQEAISKVCGDRHSVLAVFDTHENAKKCIDKIIEDSERSYRYDGDGFKVTKENSIKKDLDTILVVDRGECVRDINMITYIGNHCWRYRFYIKRETVRTLAGGLINEYEG